MRWLFPGSEVRIDTRCLDCGQPIVIRLKDDHIPEINPSTVVGHMNIPFAQALTQKVPWGTA